MGEPGRPLIEEPHYEGDQVVRVRDVVSDAIVDIYINNIFANSVQATDSKIEVNLPKALSLQDKVKTKAHFCGQTQESPIATVNPRPVSSSGYSQVKIYNCHTERHTLEVWVLDHTDGTSNNAGSIYQQYNDWGTCPAQGDPMEIDLIDGHAYEIVLVDVDAIGCGVNDPLVVACRRQEFTVLGSNNGPLLPVTVA